ncbi:hypothetical protein [Candidatus Nitronereus thalassa]|uniref:Uncharacterized protein n=1 Tax=Candidatus Nitronereus thalassa TaxID=3020898 RepID=A0ABU3K7Y4_9BACT|nr:hypothetical protein [Candidatus Nitronereus thalassa]MDT7042511.1 hypothetical protein [Candidatus Nitronereus thalassa]
MKKQNFIKLTMIAWSITWGMGLAWAGPAGSQFIPQNPVQESLYLAGKNVEEAWEAFHHAALGGTLASPDMQTKIEEALHTSRLLLVDARNAARDNDTKTVFKITNRIEKISDQIKEDSQRPKQ